MILIGFLFYRSHERPVYRIDSRTIKRGSQVSNLVKSLWRAQTFAYLAYHLSWFLFRSSPCWVLVLVVVFMTNPSSSKTDFFWKICCVFVLEILSVHLRDRVHTSPWVVSPLCLWPLIFPLFVVKLLSLPFQRNWIHLIWSSYEKVIAFQVLQ